MAKLWKVSARTSHTDWVELNVFENEKDARDLAKAVLDGGGHEVMIETESTGADAYDQA